MRNNKLILLMAAAAFISVTLSTCSLSGQKNIAAQNALKALKKVQAAVEVGTQYQQYNQLVIEAKAAVNDASSQLPEGELKGELEAAIEAYADAGEGWAKSEISNQPLIGQKRILRLKSLYGEELVGQRLREKYRIKTFMEALYEGKKDTMGVIGSTADYLMTDDMLHAIWKEAQGHIKRAEELLR